MNAQLLDLEFTVVDNIRVDHKWTMETPELNGYGGGKLLVLAPSCVRDTDLADVNALAITPSGKEVPLEFDKLIVSKVGCISLFFEGIFVTTVPVGSKVRFERAADDDTQYVAQGRLDIPEADRILPRLEKEGIRFQIDTDLSTHPSGKCAFRDGRIALFVHVDDVPAWEKVRADYFP